MALDGINLYTLYPNMISAKFALVEIFPLVLEKVIFNYVNVFLLFRNYLPLDKSLHLNKLESPSSKDLVEIGTVGLEKTIFTFHHNIYTISQIFPLGN